MKKPDLSKSEFNKIRALYSSLNESHIIAFTNLAKQEGLEKSDEEIKKNYELVTDSINRMKDREDVNAKALAEQNRKLENLFVGLDALNDSMQYKDELLKSSVKAVDGATKKAFDSSVYALKSNWLIGLFIGISVGIITNIPFYLFQQISMAKVTGYYIGDMIFVFICGFGIGKFIIERKEQKNKSINYDKYLNED